MMNVKHGYVNSCVALKILGTFLFELILISSLQEANTTSIVAASGANEDGLRPRMLKLLVEGDATYETEEAFWLPLQKKF